MVNDNYEKNKFFIDKICSFKIFYLLNVQSALLYMNIYYSRTRPKYFVGTQQFCPNFFNDCLNFNFALLHGHARIAQRFNVKTFLSFTCFFNCK